MPQPPSTKDRYLLDETLYNPPPVDGVFGEDTPTFLGISGGMDDVRRLAAAILRADQGENLSVEIYAQTTPPGLDVVRVITAKNTLVTLFDAEVDADPASLSRLRSFLRLSTLRFFVAIPVVAGRGGTSTNFGDLLVGDACTPRRLDHLQERALIALGHQLGTLVALEQHKRRLEAETVRLSALATTDGLTGLANRRSFGDRLATAVVYARQTETPLSLILLDVDRFKSYNDMFGHPAGDEVLRQVGRILSRVARDSDLPARYGGEEFVVLATETDGETGAIIADLFRSEIASSSFAHREVTASFGVAELTPFMAGGNDLVSAADAALYRSKAEGRNRVTLSDTNGS
ncbi:MAG: GGDEF domain-containing protein [Akkermansiaceae bacterium]|nr:GGDEF domain-containing protein [Armatimonadota bacterium]